MFSTGMPILLLLACLCLTTRYFTDKYTTLNLFTRPSYVNSSLNQWTIRYLPIMCCWHSIVAVFQLTTPSIFPQTFEDQYHDGDI